ncbi:MAG: tetratricopeptide repeat protein [Bdellovibrionales bacterium]|nr:tetratricopeptide repeat protein [Bdellovibrionales bacterium]
MRKYFILIFLFFIGCQKQSTTIQDYQVIKLPSSDRWKSYHYYLQGEIAANYGLYEDAVNFFENASQINSDIDIRYRLAVEHARNFRFEPALTIVEDILQKDPDNFFAILLRAKINATKGNYEESQDDFRLVLEHPELQKHPYEKIRTQLSLVALQIEAKDYKAAKELLEKMQKEDPNNELAYYYMARVYTEEGNLDKAQKYFEKTIQVNEDFVLSYRALALMYDYRDESDKQIEVMEKIIKIQPQDIQTRTQLIRLYMANEKLGDAKKHENYFENRFEENIQFCFELGLFYVQNKMFHSADQVFEKCQKIYPEDDQLRYYHALSLYYIDRKDESLDAFSSIQPLSEFYEKSILARASILRELQTHQQIVEVFEQGLKAKSTSPEIPLHYARYQFERDNNDEAREILKRALRKFEKDEPLALLLAEIYEKEKSYIEMEKILRNVISNNPSSASALNFLGYSYADRNIELQQAEALILKALEIKPQDGYIQDSLAWVYFKQKKYDQALKIIEVAVKFVPNEAIIWEHYGDILYQLNKPKKALEAYNKALELEKNDDKKKKIQNKISASSK